MSHLLPGRRQTLKLTAINLNTAAPADIGTFNMPSVKWIPTKLIIFNPSGSVPLTTLGLYSAAAAGGTVLVTPAALANLTATGKFVDMTVISLTDVITTAVAVIRLTVAAGGAGTADALLEFIDLS
jgi:hypothetical protein